jgi:hypothetical protein
LEGLGTLKTLKNQWFFKVFAVVRFRYFGALDAPLWLILAPLGPIWSQNGSQNGFPDGSKSSQDPPFWRSVSTVPGSRRVPKSLIFIVKNKGLGKMRPLSWRARGTVPGSRSYLKSCCFQDGPKMAPDGPEEPKTAPR